MLVEVLLIFHIAVLGYWLGSEFVINSGYRYVCRGSSMPFDERNRLMEHVMDVDQHVRYALVLQAGLGTVLAALLGYVPGGSTLAWGAGIVGILWLGFVETIHRVRHAGLGQKLALLDRVIRYVLLFFLFVVGVAAALDAISLQGWFALKLVLFGCVMASGVGIRISIIEFFRVWREIEATGSTTEREKEIWWIYTWGTAILVLLWVFIAAIVVLSVMKPG
ncbi:MAG: hypothetical protein OSB02_12100 [Rhodospirillaceae bacterium]|nr:hypothetical protein [Rhodospirillaceae bacterium]